MNVRVAFCAWHVRAFVSHGMCERSCRVLCMACASVPRGEGKLNALTRGQAQCIDQAWAGFFMPCWELPVLPDQHPRGGCWSHGRLSSWHVEAGRLLASCLPGLLWARRYERSLTALRRMMILVGRRFSSAVLYTVSPAGFACSCVPSKLLVAWIEASFSLLLSAAVLSRSQPLSSARFLSREWSARAAEVPPPVP